MTPSPHHTRRGFLAAIGGASMAGAAQTTIFNTEADIDVALRAIRTELIKG